jgi:murein DD-endopeptidase MepM/ murein hydrolase activator NlpD
MVARLNQGDYRLYYLGAADRLPSGGRHLGVAWWGPPYRPLAGSAAGLNRFLAGDLPFSGPVPVRPEPASQPAPPRHAWFAGPSLAADGNPHIDATYRYGSTMGGNFQQHQGVEFNNPAGTPVRAIGDGVVVFAGAAEQGANTVAIRHDRQWEGQYVFSTYYHNTSLDVRRAARACGRRHRARRQHRAARRTTTCTSRCTSRRYRTRPRSSIPTCASRRTR